MLSPHSKKNPRKSAASASTKESTSTTGTTTSTHSQAMPNIVPPTSASPSFSESSTGSASPLQQQQQQRTYYWHASAPSAQPTYHHHYGPVVVEPYYYGQQPQHQPQQQPQQNEWTSPPPTNDVYQQMEALQTQVHEWRNNAQSWQRHCDEINRAHEKETLKLKAKVNELLRQKTVLMEKVRRYKTAVSVASSPKNSSSSSKKENATPVSPLTKQQVPETQKHVVTKQPVSILKSPKRSCMVPSGRPLKKRRVRLDDTQQQVRCISPRTVSSAPPMPVTPPMQVKWAAL